ncbi:ethylene-responsive transcription factor ERF019-like [Malania oleifera]|uniref:ethylene-responsive transcription factor ERF019-like n=1 Tax=Malania oleifera TaxID=397392 RepID=UPI0025AE61DD|nr:ethylene-responsive transcription factor ERF019-like [Malania oleifera]
MSSSSNSSWACAPEGCSSSSSSSSAAAAGAHLKKYKGVRRRKWGKWVSEIRVPGTQGRLWLGSYATAEAAAMAHDIAFFCLRGPSSPDGLNFPHCLPPGLRTDMSPRSIQKVASDAGTAIDAQLLVRLSPAETTEMHAAVGVQEGEVWEEENYNDYGNNNNNNATTTTTWEGSGEGLSISVEDYLYQ